MPTASALVSDLIKAAKTQTHAMPAVAEHDGVLADDWTCVHFIRMRAKDQPGVLSAVSGKFGEYCVSIASMVQKGHAQESGYAQLVFLTHKASEKAVRKALGELDDTLISEVSVIRVEMD